MFDVMHRKTNEKVWCGRLKCLLNRKEVQFKSAPKFIRDPTCVPVEIQRTQLPPPPLSPSLVTAQLILIAHWHHHRLHHPTDTDMTDILSLITLASLSRDQDINMILLVLPWCLSNQMTPARATKNAPASYSRRCSLKDCNNNIGFSSVCFSFIQHTRTRTTFTRFRLLMSHCKFKQSFDWSIVRVQK